MSQTSEERSVSITLTAAQIATLDTVPVQILPSPGAGYVTLITGYIARKHFVTTEPTFVAPATGLAQFAPRGTAGLGTAFLLEELLTTLTGEDAVVAESYGFIQALLAEAENKPIDLSLGVDTLSGGDCTIALTVFYRILAIPS